MVRTFISSFDRGSPVATATFSSEHPVSDAAAKNAAASFIHPFIVIPFTGPARNYLSSFFTKSRM